MPANSRRQEWAIGAACLSLLLIFGPAYLEQPLDLLPYIALFAGSFVMLLGLYARPAQRWWGKLAKSAMVMLLALILLVLSFVIPVAVMGAMTAPAAAKELNIGCGPSLECHVHSRGAFGSYWQVLVQRQRYLGVFYVDTALEQFDREVVNTMRWDAQAKRLFLEVQEYGQAPRSLEFDLPK